MLQIRNEVLRKRTLSTLLSISAYLSLFHDEKEAVEVWCRRVTRLYLRTTTLFAFRLAIHITVYSREGSNSNIVGTTAKKNDKEPCMGFNPSL